MPNWYLYYRLLLALRYVPSGSTNIKPRLELQDVFSDLRDKAASDLKWTDQHTQDFFESLVAQYDPQYRSGRFTVDEAMRRIQTENRYEV